MLDSIRMGDNVVWQVSSMDDYMHFVTPLCNQLHEEGKELLYMHFSGHPALLQTGNGSRVYEFDPSEGFEAFTMNVRRRIKAEGRDQVAHQGGVVYRGIQGVHAAEGEVQQLHDKPHRCRNCHSKCSVHEQNVFFLKGLPVAHCFSLLIRSGVPPQTFCGDQPIISLIFS